MTKIINMLTNVQTGEVSLVRRGANNKRFALTKSEYAMNINELVKTVLSTEAEGESALVSTMKSAGLDEDSIAVAVANFRLQSGFSDKFSKEAFAEVAKASGYEPAKGKKKKSEGEDEDEDKKPSFMKSSTPADIPEPMRKAYEEQKATIARLQKEAEENSTKLTALRKEAERKEYVAKCATEYAHVPGMSSEEMGGMLQDAYEVSKDLGEKLEKQWAETSKALKESALLKTAGAVTTHDGSSAWAKMQKMAAEAQKKDPSLGSGQAMTQVIKQHPDLYNEYLSENPAQTGGR